MALFHSVRATIIVRFDDVISKVSQVVLADELSHVFLMKAVFFFSC